LDNVVRGTSADNPYALKRDRRLIARGKIRTGSTVAEVEALALRNSHLTASFCERKKLPDFG
jgi:hypothetical protein